MGLAGNIERSDREVIAGWAWDDADPGAPVTLAVHVDGARVTRVLANIHRRDLEEAGIGDGRHGFHFSLDWLAPFEPHTIELMREEDGMRLPGSPRLIPPATELDGPLMARLATMLGDTPDDAVLLRRAAFLAQQADRLLQKRADRAGFGAGLQAQRAYRARWSGRTGAPPPPPPRALIIDDTLPDRGRDAGSRAVLSHAQSLQRLGFSVAIAPSDAGGGALADDLEVERIAAYCAPWTGSVEEVLRREAPSWNLIYIHRASNVRYLSLIRHHCPRARVIYSVADLHHLRFARQAEVEQRPELTDLSQRMRVMELSAGRMVDAVITHSPAEAALLAPELPPGRVHVVPWAVTPAPIAVPFEQRHGFAMVGHWNHAPNLDGAWWLIQDIMPLIHDRDPAIECQLVGTAMPDTLAAGVAPGMRAVGAVDDLGSVFGAVRLTIAPLAYGAGIKGKVLDSLAAGIPCVCSTIAAEGLDLPAPLQALVSDQPAGLADAVIRLHNDPQLNQACAEAGLSYIASRFSPARVDAMLRAAAGLLPAAG